MLARLSSTHCPTLSSSHPPLPSPPSLPGSISTGRGSYGLSAGPGGGGERPGEGERVRVREGGRGILSFTLLISKTCLRFNLLLPLSLPPSLPPSLPQIRRTAIKTLPDICKYSSDPSLCTKVVEYLTQLLATGSVTTHTMTPTCHQYM